MIISVFLHHRPQQKPDTRRSSGNLINGTQELFDKLKQFGVNIHYLGGETADVGDVVRTIAVNGP